MRRAVPCIDLLGYFLCVIFCNVCISGRSITFSPNGDQNSTSIICVSLAIIEMPINCVVLFLPKYVAISLLFSFISWSYFNIIVGHLPHPHRHPTRAFSNVLM